jgi:hypothetical protein
LVKRRTMVGGQRAGNTRVDFFFRTPMGEGAAIRSGNLANIF